MYANQPPPLNELVTRAELLRRNPRIPSDDAIRWALRKRATNGLAGAVFKSRSRTLLIHEPTFLRWFFRLPMPVLIGESNAASGKKAIVRAAALDSTSAATETRKGSGAPLDGSVPPSRNSVDSLFE